LKPLGPPEDKSYSAGTALTARPLSFRAWRMDAATCMGKRQPDQSDVSAATFYGRARNSTSSLLHVHSAGGGGWGDVAVRYAVRYAVRNAVRLRCGTRCGWDDGARKATAVCAHGARGTLTAGEAGGARGARRPKPPSVNSGVCVCGVCAVRAPAVLWVRVGDL